MGLVRARSGPGVRGNVLPRRIRPERQPRTHSRGSARPPLSGPFRLADCARPNRSPSPNRPVSRNAARRLAELDARPHLARPPPHSAGAPGDSAQPPTLDLPPRDLRTLSARESAQGCRLATLAAGAHRLGQVATPCEVVASDEAVTAAGIANPGKAATPSGIATARKAATPNAIANPGKASRRVESLPGAGSPPRPGSPRQARSPRRGDRQLGRGRHVVRADRAWSRVSRWPADRGAALTGTVWPSGVLRLAVWQTRPPNSDRAARVRQHKPVNPRPSAQVSQHRSASTGQPAQVSQHRSAHPPNQARPAHPTRSSQTGPLSSPREKTARNREKTPLHRTT
ncbi:hypothetical protein A4R44_07272 [Amycolatopsis sp. M39]|nr:hypothetical protein A4R44_07272 [Amycolatopsis sp. M39]